jgi:hypothetical protein
MQVGALEPGAHESLQATLIIRHPHEDTIYTQGSFLKPELVQRLELLQLHPELLQAQADIHARIMQVSTVALPVLIPLSHVLRSLTADHPLRLDASTPHALLCDCAAAARAEAAPYGPWCIHDASGYALGAYFFPGRNIEVYDHRRGRIGSRDMRGGDGR